MNTIACFAVYTALFSKNKECRLLKPKNVYCLPQVICTYLAVQRISTNTTYAES